MRLRLLLPLLWLLLLPLGVPAAELEVPLRVPYALLGGPLTEVPASAAPATLYEDGPCRRFRTGERHLELRGDGLHSVSRVEVALGMSLFGSCVGPLDWRGSADLLLEPYLDSDWQLRFRVGDTRLRDDEGRSAPLLGLVWEFARHRLNREMAAYAFDLGAPREEAQALLRASAPAAALPELETLLASLELRDPVAGADGVRVTLRLTLPPAWLPEAPAPAPPVDAVARQRLLEQMDAFLVFAVKQVGLDLEDAAIRQRLLGLLLESRYRLVEILDGRADTTQGDPVRRLLEDDWKSLREVLLDAEERGLAGGVKLGRYTAFLNAGDVLVALDAAAPEVGLWVSADGLRRLAHSLQPAASGDPLEYRSEVDPLLRRLFGFPPEPPPMLLPVPPPSSWLDWLVRPAQAAEDPLALVAQRLHRWIPKDEELPEYRAWVLALLRLVTAQELADAGLEEQPATVFQSLVPATAMMESCWRQYVRSGGKVGPVTSSTGSLGMMQVNPRVWRGFYDVERLKGEVAYNARAGTQILLRYLKDPGLAVAKRSGHPEYLPRATYAAYNAGPGGARRFLTKEGALRAGAVDRRLWRLYQGFSRGGLPDLGRCEMEAP